MALALLHLFWILLKAQAKADNRKGQSKSFIRPIIPCTDPGTSDGNSGRQTGTCTSKTGTRVGSSLIQCRAHPELSVSALIFHIVSHRLCPSAPLPFFFSPLNVVFHPPLSSLFSIHLFYLLSFEFHQRLLTPILE